MRGSGRVRRVNGKRVGKGRWTDLIIGGVTVRIWKGKERGKVAEKFCNYPDNYCNATIFHNAVDGIPGVRYYIQVSEEIFRINLKRAVLQDDIHILNGLHHTQVHNR